MPLPLTSDNISDLLEPYLLANASLPGGLCSRLAIYLELLLKWNARTNLTAIRDPQEIVQRHFGESLFAGQYLLELGLEPGATLLDFGSGAGFPGVPIQFLLPKLRVTLAESQNKKSAFLHEVVRALDLKTEVWAHRVESMPANRTFDIVTLRAVDNMGDAIAAAARRASKRIVLFISLRQAISVIDGFVLEAEMPVPGIAALRLLIFVRVNGELEPFSKPVSDNVPRGTFA